MRTLGRLLGEVLAEQEGRQTLDLEEKVRGLAIARRRGPRADRADAGRQLAALLEELPITQARDMIRAFGTYFELVNLAEQHHRIRRGRAHAADVDAPPSGAPSPRCSSRPGAAGSRRRTPGLRSRRSR
ncbi:phosphoenolpyruvate carboxylase [Vulgatibacter incomptus]|uniref:phosphoenolpyruvate carboxylase n=1 Tax=Vulgatibacter incomptus TaxID=1391653 RepID=UPI0023E3AB6E|nr:phosphoenolpyruvate carboxylase [Vulgatibacter incomptus]